MLTRERFARIYAHQEADRIPNSVPLATMERIVARVKEAGWY